MEFCKAFFEPFSPLTNICGPRIVGTVGKPQGNVAAVQLLRQIGAFQKVSQRRSSRKRIRATHGAMFVKLFLKHIWVDGPWPHAKLFGQSFDLRDAAHTFRQVPQNVQGNRRANARQPVDFTGIAEFFLDRRCRGRLQKFPETCSGIREAPGRQFNLK